MRAVLLFVLTLFTLSTAADRLQAAPRHRYGGQGLILVVSDAVLGHFSEVAQQIPIAARPWLYKYDRVAVVYGTGLFKVTSFRKPRPKWHNR